MDQMVISVNMLGISFKTAKICTDVYCDVVSIALFPIIMHVNKQLKIS